MEKSNIRQVSDPIYIGNILVKRKEISDISMHWHDFWECDLIISGAGKTCFNGVEYPIKAGCVTFAKISDFHEYAPEGICQLYSIQVSKTCCDFLDVVGNGISGVVFLSKNVLSDVVSLCRLMERAQKNGYPESYMLQLLQCMIALVNSQRQTGGNHGNMALIHKILTYVDGNFTGNPAAWEVADQFHMSPNYFSSYFASEVGKPYKTYLRELRLGYARKLLFSTDLSVTEICDKCGYHDFSHFLREYKAEYGISPLQERKQFHDARHLHQK